MAAAANMSLMYIAEMIESGAMTAISAAASWTCGGDRYPQTGARLMESALATPSRTSKDALLRPIALLCGKNKPLAAKILIDDISSIEEPLRS
jgi:hypothetical protein